MPNSDVLPRSGFNQMVRNMRCQLYFPYPSEQVVLLRTGVLVHINAYMHGLGLTSAPKPEQPSNPPDPNPEVQTSCKPPVTEDSSANGEQPEHAQAVLGSDVPGDVDANSSMRDAEGSGPARVADPVEAQASQGGQGSAKRDSPPSAAAVLDWHGPVRPEKREELLRTWQHLKETVEALPHVGCYTVASVAYRRYVRPGWPHVIQASAACHCCTVCSMPWRKFSIRIGSVFVGTSIACLVLPHSHTSQVHLLKYETGFHMNVCQSLPGAVH